MFAKEKKHQDPVPERVDVFLTKNIDVSTLSLQKLQDSHFNLLCLTEMNVNVNHPSLASKFNQSLASFHQCPLHLFTRTPGFSSDIPYQQGCLLSVCSPALDKRISMTCTDIYGRWQLNTLQTPDLKLHILNVYVPQFTRGATTVYSQLRNTMSDFQDRRDPIRAFYEDIVSVIKRLLHDSPFLIVGGDFNDHMETSEHMRSKFEEMNLINYAYLLDPHPPRTYIRRGCSPVDHVWVSQASVQRVTNFGFLPDYFAFHSDHRGLFLDFNSGQSLDKLPTPTPKRPLNSKNVKMRTRYLKTVRAQVDKFGLLERINNMKREFFSSHNTSLLQRKEELDALLTSWMLRAEKKLIPNAWQHSSFTLALQTLKMERHYWRCLFDMDIKASLMNTCENSTLHMNLIIFTLHNNPSWHVCAMWDDESRKSMSNWEKNAINFLLCSLPTMTKRASKNRRR